MALVLSKDSTDKQSGQANWHFIVESVGDRRCGEASRVCVMADSAAKSEAEQDHIIYLAKLSLGSDGLPMIEALKESDRLSEAAMHEEQAEAAAARYLDEQAEGTENLVREVMESQVLVMDSVDSDCEAIELFAKEMETKSMHTLALEECIS